MIVPCFFMLIVYALSFRLRMALFTIYLVDKKRFPSERDYSYQSRSSVRPFVRPSVRTNAG